VPTVYLSAGIRIYHRFIQLGNPFFEKSFKQRNRMLIVSIDSYIILRAQDYFLLIRYHQIDYINKQLSPPSCKKFVFSRTYYFSFIKTPNTLE